MIDEAPPRIPKTSRNIPRDRATSCRSVQIGRDGGKSGGTIVRALIVSVCLAAARSVALRRVNQRLRGLGSKQRDWETEARSLDVERFADGRNRGPEGVNWRRETPRMEICLASRTSGNLLNGGGGRSLRSVANNGGFN